MSANTKAKLAASIRRGTNLRLIFSITSMECGETVNLEPINVSDMCLVFFRFTLESNDKCKLVSMITFKKHEKAKKSSIGIKISHADFEKECTVPDEWMQFLKMGLGIETNENVGQYHNKTVHPFLINVEVNLKVYFIPPKPLPVNQKLYEDATFTDFNLKAEDGVVAVHKSVLSIHSDVFLAMLNREWTETTEGTFSINGGTNITVQTLQYFKDYMYLRTLPDDLLQLQTLFQIAACYMIDNLKMECITKIVDLVTPENFDDLVEFACLNNLPDLLKVIVTDTPDKIVKSIQENNASKKVSTEGTS